MYLHLGQGHVVYKRDVIGIFAIEGKDIPVNSEFMEGAKWGQEVTEIEGVAKSMVVTRKQVYISPLTPSTLEKRWVRQHLNL